MPGGAWQGAHTPKRSTGDSGDGKVQQWEGETPEMSSSMDGQHPKPTVQPPQALAAAPMAFSQSLFNPIPTWMGSNTSSQY